MIGLLNSLTAPVGGRRSPYNQTDYTETQTRPSRLSGVHCFRTRREALY